MLELIQRFRNDNLTKIIQDVYEHLLAAKNLGVSSFLAPLLKSNKLGSYVVENHGQYLQVYPWTYCKTGIDTLPEIDLKEFNKREKAENTCSKEVCQAFLYSQSVITKIKMKP